MPFTHSRAWLGALLALACFMVATHPANAQASIDSYAVTPMNLPVSGGQVNVTASISGQIGQASVEVLVYAPDNTKTTYQLTQQAGTSSFNGSFQIPGNLTTSQSVYTVYIEAFDDTGLADERVTNVRVAAAAAAFAITGVAIMPSSVVGGGTATGTVSFNEAAPFAGIAVAFQSSNTAATLPASDTVPAGATSIMFTVSTSAVTSVQTATLTASVNSTSGSVNLAVTPASAGVPTITGFTPASGPVGTAVTITGTNLTGATVVGFQGQHAASFTVNSAGTQITTTVPNGAQTGPIAVATPGGTARSSTSFTVTANTSLPTITGFTPASGPVGTVVAITGTNLTGTSIVGFQDAHAKTFSVNSAGTQITATVPAGAVTGPIAVLTPGGEAKSSTSFSVVPAPTITGFTPASGPVGTAVTITGTNLTGTTVVGFQGKHASSFTVNSAGTQIATTVPAGAATGPIAVLTPAGEAKSSTSFTVSP